MTAEELETKKKEFIDTLLKSTNRTGLNYLINYLDNKTDFFTAPASTRYHGAYEGGLLVHSLAVYKWMNLLNTPPMDGGSIAVVALLHDICKANFYTTELRNRKNKKGVWEKYPVYTINDQLPLGHGEKSVIMIEEYMQLSDDEIMAIRWHMGSYDDAAKSYGGGITLGTAMNKCPLLVFLHMADMAATFIDKD